MAHDNNSVVVVIPAYKVRNYILNVIRSIGPEVDKIIVVDDKCPENSGSMVERSCNDKRVLVLYHDRNMGVGGAVKTGYKKALELGAEAILKLDGDGQMDPALIAEFLKPLSAGEADYVKGNRFYDPLPLLKMPALRLIGNSVLSLINKAVNGYWNIMDPVNGYTVIHRHALLHLPLEKIDNGYFFESDMLFRLGLIRAVVTDLPIRPVYETEKSNLKISRVLVNFPLKYMNRLTKRIFYNYFLRDFNIATIEMLIGIPSLLFGISTGTYHWIKSIQMNQFTSSGTVMLAALPIIIGLQLLLSALNFDIQNVPKRPLQNKPHK